MENNNNNNLNNEITENESTKTTERVNKKRLIITVIVILAFIALIVALYFGLGLNKEFSNVEGLKEKINSYGNMSKVVFVVINFLQTTIIPITNIPTILAGVALFDNPFEAATLATIGVLTGSILSFFVARIFGKKVVAWIIGSKNIDKYLTMAKGRENLIIFLVLLLPGFPDDIICMIAGLTSMSWKFFLITILLTRTFPTYIIAYMPDLIPLNTFWGILIWVALYIVVLLIGRYVLKYWDKIVEFFDKIRGNKKKDI